MQFCPRPVLICNLEIYLTITVPSANLPGLSSSFFTTDEKYEIVLSATAGHRSRIIFSL